MYPPEFLYTKDHEWIQVDESVGTIGITDYAQKELGDVVFVELPKPGDHVAAAESFGTVESVKAHSFLVRRHFHIPHPDNGTELRAVAHDDEAGPEKKVRVA